RKITQYTRYGTVLLSVVQSLGIAVYLERMTLNESFRIVENPGLAFKFMTVMTLTTGTAFIMWLGEQITERGIGNGMSLLIFAGIVVGFPRGMLDTVQMIQRGDLSLLATLFLLAMMVLVVAAIVFVERGQRRITVQYAKRVVGRRMTSGGSTYIPLKVNQAGVIPIIFASSVLYFPTLLGSVIQWPPFQRFLDNHLVNQASPVYIAIYGLLVVFFAYFYTAISFNPVDTADNIRKYGGFIPGIRPGKPTADHLDHILSRITLPGSLFLATIALIPSIALIVMGINPNIFPFGGTSVLIVVGVALETMKQIESQLTMRHYEGFLR
ncbi:MAG TPA: preprotein translocase subunit SecY, partial [Actinomycetota bacterium]|nr:preprotein translocase subunit SecY [Actinomycetota bacterium]